MSKNIIASLLDFIFIGRVTFCKQWAQRSTSGMFKRSFCAPLFLTFGCQVNYYGCEKCTIRIVLLHFLLECLNVLFVNPPTYRFQVNYYGCEKPTIRIVWRHFLFKGKVKCNSALYTFRFVLQSITPKKYYKICRKSF